MCALPKCLSCIRRTQSLESAPRFLMIVPSAGVILRSIHSADFSQNPICNTAAGPAVRFAASNPNLEVASWPIFTNGNSNVLPQSNEFLGYDPDHCGLTSGTGIAAEGFSFDNSPLPGRITDGGGLNVQKDQVRRAAGTLVLGEEIRLSGRGLRLTYAVKMFFRANEELSLGGCRGRLAVLGN